FEGGRRGPAGRNSMPRSSAASIPAAMRVPETHRARKLTGPANLKASPDIPRPRSLTGARASLSVADSAQARVLQVFAHFVQSRLEARPWHLRQVGSCKGQLQLLSGHGEVAPGDLVFTHVEVGISRITSCTGRQRGQSDLLGSRWYVVEEIEQH